MLTDGNLQGINDSSTGQAQNCANYPYYTYSYPQTTYIQYVAHLPAEFEIRRVANGFSVKQNSLEYVFNSEADLCTWLTAQLAKK